MPKVNKTLSNETKNVMYIVVVLIVTKVNCKTKQGNVSVQLFTLKLTYQSPCYWKLQLEKYCRISKTQCEI